MTGNNPVRPIYLDYQATTPCDPRVVDRMVPYFTTAFGNPHSADHRHGWEAEEAVETARRQIADPIGARARDIVFTSGATESNNLAIKGAARYRREAEGRDKVVTVASEHKCVLESVARLDREGFETVILPVGSDGLVDLARLDAALDDRVAVVSIMAVNNEIGVIQPLSEIGAMARRVGAWFHTDAAQGYGKIPLNVDEMAIDLMSVSGHKIYGPKGIGALYVRGRKPKVTLAALMDGGGQERGLRSGTVPTPLCVGMGAAAEIAARENEAESSRLRGLRDDLWQRLRTTVPTLTLNGHAERRIAGNLNVTLPGIETAELLAAVPGLSISGGSACSSAGNAGSHVLQALGQDPAKTAAGIRIGLGRFTTPAEIDAAAENLIAAMTRLTGAG
ncbi:aminotransferase class V-fold PLP-dependent enzyme [Rhodospirillaceae bacterium KN72]|uniref:Cysteine desulfurase n=1 Tax=Pacificispira spongiicola TaxID=2729598 RepID=A0A7Y0DZX0_9PROT|nr:aminotransferase class V-fold PLP-dependent enzyme [Pacificispira spongiicola]NMM44568.1 aminotransferase class V-fold PLP-dependent enzyme [Pacificispira spongiicola]